MNFKKIIFCISILGCKTSHNPKKSDQTSKPLVQECFSDFCLPLTDESDDSSIDFFIIKTCDDLDQCNEYPVLPNSAIEFLSPGNYLISSKSCHQKTLTCNDFIKNSDFNQKKPNDLKLEIFLKEERLLFEELRQLISIYIENSFEFSDSKECKNSQNSLKNFLKDSSLARTWRQTDPRWIAINQKSSDLKLSGGDDKKLAVRLIVWKQPDSGKPLIELGKKIISEVHVGVLIGPIEGEGLNIKPQNQAKYYAAPYRNQWQLDVDNFDDIVEIIELPEITQEEFQNFEKKFEESKGYFDHTKFNSLKEEISLLKTGLSVQEEKKRERLSEKKYLSPEEEKKLKELNEKKKKNPLSDEEEKKLQILEKEKSDISIQYNEENNKVTSKNCAYRAMSVLKDIYPESKELEHSRFIDTPDGVVKKAKKFQSSLNSTQSSSQSLSKKSKIAIASGFVLGASAIVTGITLGVLASEGLLLGDQECIKESKKNIEAETWFMSHLNMLQVKRFESYGNSL